MSQETALISLMSMSEELKSLVQRACKDAGVHPMDWNSGSLTTLPTMTPSVLIGVLPAGERRVPDALALLGSRLAPVPLILLTQDALLHEQVVLNDGRIRLLGLPIAQDQLAKGIRQAMSGQEHQLNYRVPNLHSYHYRGDAWWAAALSRWPSACQRTAHDEIACTFPWVLSEPQSSRFSALVPQSPVKPTEPGKVYSACGACLRQLPTANTAKEVQALLPAELTGDAVILTCDTNRGLASIFGSGKAAKACIVSPQRIPPLWRFAAQGKAELQDLPLLPGDLLILHSNLASSAWPEGFGNAEDKESEFWKRARQGGEALLDHLQDALLDVQGPFAVVLFEVL